MADLSNVIVESSQCSYDMLVDTGIVSEIRLLL